MIGKPIVTFSSANLPQRLPTPWMVIPGQTLDPAILVKYVRDGMDRDLEERALWDYRIDLSNEANSYFFLSAIPRSFHVAINGFFGSQDIARGFISDLGRIGIAIGGEALRSGKRAVGAVRILSGVTNNNLNMGNETPICLGLLIPVDSFSSFFGRLTDNDKRRADLLLVTMIIPIDPSRNIKISACGIESKFISGIMTSAHVDEALAQAETTVDDFKSLTTLSLQAGALPERLALLGILRFGLRISSRCDNDPIVNQWMDIERTVFSSILSGQYEYIPSLISAMLVSTEGALVGPAESSVRSGGLWIRLTKTHWPGVHETQQVQHIRDTITKSFFGEMIAAQNNYAVSSSDATTPQLEENIAISPEDEIDDDRSIQISSVVDTIINLQPTVTQEPKALEKIFIGVDDGRRRIFYNPQSITNPLDNLNIMVTGSSGIGKTQFLKYLICMFRAQGKNVLVFDFKNDFANDPFFCRTAGLEKIFVSFDGLPYNPLIPYPVRHPETGELFLQCSQYIAGVSSTFKKAYGLGPQQQYDVTNAINNAFISAGLNPMGSIPYTDGIPFPDLSQVGETLQRDNPKAYNRLSPLFTLGLFKDQYRDLSFEALVNRAAIIDLSQIQSREIKNALAHLVVQSAYSYYSTQQHSSQIRQFIVFDEAHRVSNSDYITSLVRECRAYGVGTILSSQYPSDFNPDISASMATKVIHGNERDNERIKAIVQLLRFEGREDEIAELGRFQAIISNRQFPPTIIRTMNYPVYLVWARLQISGQISNEEALKIDGLDKSKIGIIVEQLERLGMAEEKDGIIYASMNDGRI